MMKLLGCLALVVTSVALAADPAVTNVVASQRTGTNLVDVYYSLLGGDTSRYVVTMSASTNAGQSFEFSCASISGDAGAGTSTGASNHIVWDGGTDLPNIATTQLCVRVRAETSWGSASTGSMALIPAGSFVMGNCVTNTEGNASELPLHSVSVSAFLMEKCEVTKQLWDNVYMWATNHGYQFVYAGSGKATNHPVQFVTWHDCVKWCNARSEKEGRTPCYYLSPALTVPYKTGTNDVANNWVMWTANGYRLPTEAEWEKAARGGAVGHRFPWATPETIAHTRANYTANTSTCPYDVSLTLGYHPAFSNGAAPYTSVVGYFPTNGYGLYDMAGNVWEWCWDWYDTNWYGTAGASLADTRGPTNGTWRVNRGGTFGYAASYSRCSDRGYTAPTSTGNNRGFRTVRIFESAGAGMGASQAGTFNTHAPDTPANIAPAAGATNQSLFPTLVSSAFSDPFDTHAASQWQLATNGPFAPIEHDSGEHATDLTSYTLPVSLASAGRYYWRARHKDSHGMWSAWSAITWFDTMSIAPHIDVTTLPATVQFSVTTYAVVGTNNQHVTGGMWVSNSANNAAAPFAAQSSWTAPSLALVEGTNVLWVFGTNMLGVVANDSVAIVRRSPPPNSPLGVAASDGAFSNKIAVSWIQSSNATSYAVWRNIMATTNGAANISGTIATTNYDDMAVAPGSGYWYWVMAANPNGWSDYSAPDGGYVAFGNTHYVSLSGAHVSPFMSWMTAATNLKAAVDVALDGTTVLVTNGSYCDATEIAIVRNITVTSVNGPAVTIVNGLNAHRCFLVTNGTLAGFTVSNGWVKWLSNEVGGGAGVQMMWGGTVSNCWIVKNKADGFGWQAAGGGVLCLYGGTVLDCQVRNNFAWYGGGGIKTYYGGYVKGCIVSGNSNNYGGSGICASGASVIENCLVTSNISFGSGGGIRAGANVVLRNCIVARNTATRGGGAFFDGDVQVANCTIVGNNASTAGGGLLFGDSMGMKAIDNSIVCFNTLGGSTENNYGAVAGWEVYGRISYCATKPAPGSPYGAGNGNITNDPLLAQMSSGDYRPSSDSPCIDAGSNMTWMVLVGDFDGNSRIANAVVDMGAFEFQTNTLTAPAVVMASDGTYEDKVRIAWNAVGGATTYVVYRATTTNVADAWDMSGEITDPFYDDTTVAPSVTYWYWVRAGNGGEWTGFSPGDSGYAQIYVPPNSLIQPTHLDFSTNQTARNIGVANTGCGSFTFTNVVTVGSQWLSILPRAGTVSTQSVPLVASVNRSSMATGTYIGTISVTPTMGSPVVVTCLMEVAGTSVAANPGGPYVADQGIPVMLDGSASVGNNLSYSWRVGSGSFSDSQPSNKLYSWTGYIPRTNSVTLLVEDGSVPPLTHSASSLVIVRNVAPAIDIGGPYTGTMSRAMNFSAIVTDPGTGDIHQIRWDFGSGWSAWLPASATNTSHTFASSGGYVVQCEVRDNYGGIGSDTATAMVDMPNLPPVAGAHLGTPGVTYSNYGGMHVTVLLNGSGSTDDRTNIFFDWREDVDNPAKPLLSDEARRQSNAVITFFPMPGTYRFHLVVNDGEYNSEAQTLQVNIPGIAGVVKSDGIGVVLPLYGVTLTTTNQALGQVFTETTDFEGKFVIDTGGGNGRIVTMSRNARSNVALVNVDADGIRNYVLTFAPNVCSFTALINSGYYGGVYAPIPGAYAQMVIGSDVGYSTLGDLNGLVPFGGIPELWPIDPRVNYQVMYQKIGWQSKILPAQPTPAVPTTHNPTLSPSDQCTVQGVVVGTNNMPVEGVAIHFGPIFGTVYSGSHGDFVLGGAPRGDYFVRLSASDFDTTFITVSVPVGDTNIVLAQPLVIRGGRFSVYGEVVSVTNGQPICNATVRVLQDANATLRAAQAETNTVATTRTGYYDLSVAKGARTIVVEAPGYETKTIPVDAQAHVQQPVQLMPVPEPVVAGAAATAGFWLLIVRRKRACNIPFHCLTTSRRAAPASRVTLSCCFAYTWTAAILLSPRGIPNPAAEVRETRLHRQRQSIGGVGWERDSSAPMEQSPAGEPIGGCPTQAPTFPLPPDFGGAREPFP